MTIRRLSRTLVQLMVSMLIISCIWSHAVSLAASQDSEQREFRSPASAAAALVEAARADDLKSLAAILGPDAQEVITSGDPVADNNAREDFTKRYDQMHRLAYNDRGQVILYIGADNWPLPIPIVKRNDAWVFDSAAGKEELLYRRVGRNELFTIDVLQELADAQQDYAAAQLKASEASQFAKKIFSDPGKRDGLYWPSSGDQPESPIGPLIADASAEGYRRDPGGHPVPFHGYLYSVLASQGPKAPGGAIDYIADGKMTRGFAFLAYPAEYRASGVMTFMINQDGVLVEKDLGPDTEKLAAGITTYNPDQSWSELEESE